MSPNSCNFAKTRYCRQTQAIKRGHIISCDMRLWFWKFYTTLILIYAITSLVGVDGASCDIPTLDRIIDIPENLPKGSIVKTLETANINRNGERDSTLDGKIINMTLEINPYVELNADTLSFTLLKSLDAEISYDISINILDANDNAPYFDSDIYDVSINELTPIGSTVIQDIKAIDRDIDSTNSRLTYNIQNGPFSAYFSLANPRRPTVILVKSLDYERVRSMHFTLVVEDQGEPRLRNHTIIRVTVLDGDDKNPSFVHNNYWATIYENYTLKTELEVLPEGLQAFDQDTGIRAEIQYSFEGAINNDTTDDRIFKIHPSTGSLFINNPVPNGQDYFLIIKATQGDNPDRYATTGVKVQGPRKLVESVSDYSLNLDSNPIRVNVLEDVIPGTTIISLGSRLRSYYPIIFRLVSGNKPSLPFNLTKDGDLIVTDPLDFEKVRTYELTAVAYYNNNQTQEITIIIDVINVNDNAPAFTKDLYSFRAKRQDGSYVGKIQAKDLDDDAISLKLVGSKHFSINKQGDIFIHDPEKLLGDSYEMTAVAVDNGKTPRTTTVQILIKLPSLNVTSFPATSQVLESTSFWKTRDNYLIILGALLGFALVFILILSILIAKKKISPDQKWLNSWNYIWKVSSKLCSSTNRVSHKGMMGVNTIPSRERSPSSIHDQLNNTQLSQNLPQHYSNNDAKTNNNNYDDRSIVHNGRELIPITPDEPQNSNNNGRLQKPINCNAPPLPLLPTNVINNQYEAHVSNYDPQYNANNLSQLHMALGTANFGYIPLEPDLNFNGDCLNTPRVMQLQYPVIPYQRYPIVPTDNGPDVQPALWNYVQVAHDHVENCKRIQHSTGIHLCPPPNLNHHPYYQPKVLQTFTPSKVLPTHDYERNDKSFQYYPDMSVYF